MRWLLVSQVLLEHFIEQAPLPPGAPVYVPPAPAAAGAYRYARSAASAACARLAARVQQMWGQQQSSASEWGCTCTFVHLRYCMHLSRPYTVSAAHLHQPLDES